MSEEDKTPTSYDVLTGEDRTTLTELANFLYSEYESSRLDKHSLPVDDGGDVSLATTKDSQ